MPPKLLRESERLIRESEAKFCVMADSLPSQTWAHDAEGNLLFINQAYRDFYRLLATQLRAIGSVGPIIALTADAMQGDINRCIETCCNDSLAKPIDSE